MAWLGDEVEQAFDERVGVGLRRLGGLFANGEYESTFTQANLRSEHRTFGGTANTTYSFTGPVWQESSRDHRCLDSCGRAGRARLPREGSSLDSCMHSSQLRKQSVEGSPVAVLDARAQDLVIRLFRWGELALGSVVVRPISQTRHGKAAQNTDRTQNSSPKQDRAQNKGQPWTRSTRK